MESVLASAVRSHTVMAPSYEDLEDLDDLETLPPLPNTNTPNPAAHAPVKPALDTMVEVDVRLHYQYTTNQSENDDEPNRKRRQMRRNCVKLDLCGIRHSTA